MSDDLYYQRRPRAERIALVLVLLVLVGLPLAVLGSRYAWGERGAAEGVRVIEVVGRLPTSAQGGWSPDLITVQAGERVRLRVSSADVVHGFAVPKLGIESVWVEPGKVTAIEFLADAPGRYDFLCTIYCEATHWRMRGAIEVIDPNQPGAARDPSPPQTDWLAAGLDIDAPHAAAVIPLDRPTAARGAALWQQVSSRPLGALAASDPRALAPVEVFALLADPELPEASALAGRDPQARWDITAALWQSRTSPAALALGARLYARDCVGCHGGLGQGDGPAAATIAAQAATGGMDSGHGMGHEVTDFTDLASQMGASDLLYYGKLVRGGMGTSMPYWGTVYTEEELWAVIAHLRGFAFVYAK